MDVDVLVVGAGPTGLMLANQLARRGIHPLVIDRHSGPAEQTRAIGVQARTLEIYAWLGIIEKALALGMRATGANMWANGRWTARIPVRDIGADLSPYPFILFLGQDDNERIMGERLREYGVDIAWNTELVALEQHEGEVACTLRQPDGSTRSVTAAWVAGCDGSRSAVRDLNGITFPGAPYEHVFFVADTEATGPMQPAEANVFLWRNGFHLFFPMRGKDRWRVIGILPAALAGDEKVDFAQVVPSLLREAGADLVFKSCSWFSTYRIHHRAAERFRRGRCFILGDAAHVHSPAGAQGMNTGLQDAYNLAWKLALVVKGQAREELLASFETERMPVAARLLRTTDRVFQLVVSDGWLAGMLRTWVIARLAARALSFERIRRLVFRTVSQIAIRYRQSPLSQTLPGLPEGAPLAGERFPWMHLVLHPEGDAEDLYRHLDDTAFNLLLFGQPPFVAGRLERLGRLLALHAVPEHAENVAALARAKVPTPSAYLLRPDGHVALCGPRLDAERIERYLREHAHLLL